MPIAEATPIPAIMPTEMPWLSCNGLGVAEAEVIRDDDWVDLLDEPGVRDHVVGVSDGLLKYFQVTVFPFVVPISA
jgi:hypothetical protein